MLSIFFTLGIELIQVHQKPENLVLSLGTKLNVSCSITGTTNPDLYWYRWTSAAGFTLVFTSRSVGLVDPVSEGQFRSQRPADLQLVLESAGVNETGSAVWYCAASLHTIPEHTYSCTKTIPSQVRVLFRLLAFLDAGCIENSIQTVTERILTVIF
uniref:Ig-like domain-containing protein n=1 Tax=Electrophorus electricus TaxID=8005 RepID=A0AAY5EJK5_ELEEL